jgi:hypothetical protein
MSHHLSAFSFPPCCLLFKTNAPKNQSESEIGLRPTIDHTFARVGLGVFRMAGAGIPPAGSPRLASSNWGPHPSCQWRASPVP